MVLSLEAVATCPVRDTASALIVSLCRPCFVCMSRLETRSHTLQFTKEVGWGLSARADGLRFEPLPDTTRACSCRANHDRSLLTIQAHEAGCVCCKPSPYGQHTDAAAKAPDQHLGTLRLKAEQACASVACQGVGLCQDAQV